MMYRVLVADDEPIERMIVGRTIKKYFSGQLEVVEAVNGREAAKFFTEKDCKIALLDIEMPGVNGLEAAEQIREKDRDCSIIFLTAFDEFSYAKRAISVHALDYLLKPGTEEELVALIRQIIREENPVYVDLENVPASWKDQTKALLDAGAVNGGTDADTCATDLNLNKDTLKAAIIAARYCDAKTGTK